MRASKLYTELQIFFENSFAQLTPLGGELIAAATLKDLVDSYADAFVKHDLPYLSAYVIAGSLLFTFVMDKMGKSNHRLLQQANALWLTTLELVGFKAFLMRQVMTARSGLAGFRGEEVDISAVEYFLEDALCWFMTLMNRSPVFLQQTLAILPLSIHTKWHSFWHPEPDLMAVFLHNKRQEVLRRGKEYLKLSSEYVPQASSVGLNEDDVPNIDYIHMYGQDGARLEEQQAELLHSDRPQTCYSDKSYWVKKGIYRTVRRLTWRSAANFEAILNWGVFMHAVPAIAEGIAIAARNDKGYTGTAAMVWRSLRYGFAIAGMGFGACENFSQKNRERLYFLILFLYAAIVLPFFQITKRDEIKGWPQGAMLFSFIFVLLTELAILAINFGRVIGSGLLRLNQAVPDEVDMLRKVGSSLSSGSQRFFGRNEDPVRQSVVVEMSENLLPEEDMSSSLGVDDGSGLGVFSEAGGPFSPTTEWPETDARYSVSDGDLTDVVPPSTESSCSLFM